MRKLAVVLSLLALPVALPTDAQSNARSGECCADARLDQILSDLYSKDARTRGLAAQECGKLGPAAAPAIPRLLELLDDNRVFQWGITDEIDHPWLSSTPGRQAAYALARIGEPAVEGLIRTARGRNALGRLGTVVALGIIDDPRGLDVMLAAMKDRNAKVREAAAAALPFDPRTLQPYIRALKDRDANVRLEAARSLGGDWATLAVEPLVSLVLRERDGNVACTAIRSLADSKDPRAADALAAVLGDAEKDSLARACAASSLAAFPRNAAVFDAALAAADDPDEDVAVAAIGALGWLQDARAMPLLLRQLGLPPGDSHRVYAIRALGELGDRRAIEPLIRVLLATGDGGSSSLERGTAATALGKIGDPGAVHALRGALRDRDANVRSKAAKALEALDAPGRERRRTRHSRSLAR